jgi:uncharacterized membrane protein
MSDAAQTEAPATGDARLIVLIAYGLFFASLVTGGLSAIVGVAVAYIKRPEVRGTVWESHFTNLIHVFWVAMVAFALWLAAMTASVLGIWSGIETDRVPLLVGLLPAAYLSAMLFLVWYVYRTIKGFLRAVERAPYV